MAHATAYKTPGPRCKLAIFVKGKEVVARPFNMHTPMVQVSPLENICECIENCTEKKVTAMESQISWKECKWSLKRNG